MGRDDGNLFSRLFGLPAESMAEVIYRDRAKARNLRLFKSCPFPNRVQL